MTDDRIQLFPGMFVAVGVCLSAAPRLSLPLLRTPPSALRWAADAGFGDLSASALSGHRIDEGER